MRRRHELVFSTIVGAAAALLAAGSGVSCATECSHDTDCGEGRSCSDGSCVQADDPSGLPPGGCSEDTDCAEGEGCYQRKCIDLPLVPDPVTCPAQPLSEQLRCTDWDGDVCPCYAGVVSFHEKDEGGRLSCAGVVGIFSQFLYLKQTGCHLEALDDQLTGDAVGYGELKLRIAKLPNDTSCSVEPDTWAPEPGVEGRPAVRITCSPTCTIWMEQYPTPAPERVVPDGSFLMGSSLEELPTDRPDEAPQHLVDVTCFYMDRFEVSRGDYEQCLGAGVCGHPDYAAVGEDHATFFDGARRSLPMTFVTHQQADAFCKFNEKWLPTEAEWERAARANRQGMASYPWGEEPPFDASGGRECGTANFAGCGDAPLPVDNGGGDTVRQNGVSYFDVVDLGGNVAEWTRDYYADDTYSLRAATSGMDGSKNPEKLSPGPMGDVRVIRGGSFRTRLDPAAAPPRDDLRSRARGYAASNEARDDLGFRCVRYKPGVAR